MAEAKWDSNRVTTIIGKDSGGVIRNAFVDGVTGRLLLRIAATSGASSQIFQVAKRDANRVTTEMCVMSDGTLQGILVDADRNLYVSA